MTYRDNDCCGDTCRVTTVMIPGPQGGKGTKGIRRKTWSSIRRRHYPQRRCCRRKRTWGLPVRRPLLF